MSRAGGSPEFAKLWGAQSVSQLGTNLGALGLTALVFLEATPAQMGILAAATSAPVAAIALPAGAWIDRARRRLVMIGADVLRMLMVGVAAFGAWTGQLEIVHLYVAGAIVGALTVLFDLAYRSYLPGLVGRPGLVEANRRLYASEAAAESGGPALGGIVVQVLGAPVALAADAVTFAVSAVLVATIRAPEVPRRPPSRFGPADLTEGVRTLLSHPVLRAIGGSAAILQFFGGFFFALYGVFVVQELGLPASALGILVGVGGVGSLIGSLAAGRAATRFGVGPTIIAGRLVVGAFAFVTAAAAGPPAAAFLMLLVPQMLGDPFWTLADVGETSLRQSITPDHLLGRVNAAIQLLQGALLPLGAVTAGYLATAFSPRAALFVAAVGLTARGLWLLRTPVRSIRAIDA